MYNNTQTCNHVLTQSPLTKTFTKPLSFTCIVIFLKILYYYLSDVSAGFCLSLFLSLSLSLRATCHDDSVEYFSSFLLSPSPLTILAHTQSPTSPCKIDRRQTRGADSADGATAAILSFWHTRARARCLVKREEQKREKCCARKMRRSSNAYCESCENSKKKICCTE